MAGVTAIVMEPADNVATALQDIEPRTEVRLPVADDGLTVCIREKIGSGHKFAIRDIPKGRRIVKYGETIGIATQDIQSGQHVHVHNIESTRGRGDRETPG